MVGISRSMKLFGVQAFSRSLLPHPQCVPPVLGVQEELWPSAMDFLEVPQCISVYISLART